MRSTTITLSILSVLTLALAAPVPAARDAATAPALGATPPVGAVGTADKMVKKLNRNRKPTPSTKVSKKTKQTGTSNNPAQALRAAKVKAATTSQAAAKMNTKAAKAAKKTANKIAKLVAANVLLSTAPVSATSAATLKKNLKTIARLQRSKAVGTKKTNAAAKKDAKLSTPPTTKKVVARQVTAPAADKVPCSKKTKSLAAKMKKAATNLKKKVSKIAKASVKKTSKKTKGKKAKTNGKAKKVKTAKAKKVKAAAKAKVAPIVA